MLKFVLPLILLFSAANGLSAQCDSNFLAVRLEINPDYYWYEVHWKITNPSGTQAFAQGEPNGEAAQEFNYCLPEGNCYVFHITDDYGDGMLPDGLYRLYVDNVLLYENIGGAYGFGEVVSFECPPGTFCNNAFPLDLGQHETPTGSETWYTFTPQDTGTYKISTCDAGLNCPTKIWVYDQCANINVTNNNLGTIFYSDGGCANGAEATLYLAAGKEYFIRMAYAQGNCNNEPIGFNLSYEGPVVGCTDPLACNYQPLATVTGPCIYPGDPECNDLPDLVVLEDVLRNSMSIDVLNNADACAVEEGCIRGFGTRILMRFTTHIKNIGVADYFIGETPSSPSTPTDQFVWDPCHGHWHYRGYADYLLFDASGVRIPIGSKNGFCVLDLECSDGGNGKYTCGNMGISAQCGDIYDASLPCQWIDITGISAGTYTMVVRVNWDKSPDKTGRLESTYDNNWAQACFELQYDVLGVPSFELISDCPVYTDCTGEAFGASQPDCNGICNGPSLIGDWNQDTLRNTADLDAYLVTALTTNSMAASCVDLEVNDTIDVYDAALLQECLLHADDPQYWGTRFACQFPGGVPNPDDIVYLLPGALDTINKTFDVQIVNPFSKMIGFEFSLTGLDISSVENISGSYAADWQINAADGKLLALAADEIGLTKHVLPGEFIRVHYSALTANNICISHIQAIVNEKYQRCNAKLADPNCVTVGTSGTDDLSLNGFRVFAVPNPAQDHFTLFFDNPDFSPTHIVLTDAAGRVVRNFEGLRTESVTIQRQGLPGGIYTYFVQTKSGSAVGRMVLMGN
ncbi:MAG: T9SS type A sorting domain-containing protein [Lewinellaceae bacterium]|nr:T9SS type A sorting domain-containing protein [Lewinellaceae bacterium]